MDEVQIQAQIDFLLVALTAARTLYLKLLANPAKSYNVNTGQTQESVSRIDLAAAKDTIDSLTSELNALYAQQNGNASIIVIPGF